MSVGVALVLVSVLVLPTVAYAEVETLKLPILPGRSVRHLPTTHRVVALTFDDWYDPGYLKSILATLKAAGVTATFFPTGACVANDPALARSIVAAGCTIGNHSYSHPVTSRISSEQFISELQMTEEAHAQAGLPDPVPLFRSPYGTWNGKMYRALKREGYVDVLWNSSAGDTAPGGRLVSTAIKLVMLGVKPGAIVLMHASKPTSAACLPELIRRIEADGYRIVDLSEVMFTPEQRMPRYQESSALLAYRGSWTKSASQSESGGSIHSTNTAGSSVTASFTGPTFEWLARTGPDCGKALVIIDGAPKHIVDLYSPWYAHRHSVMKVTSLGDGTHRLTISYLGTKNGASTGCSIDVDAVRVSGKLLRASGHPLPGSGGWWGIMRTWSACQADI
jgi:peptidoglycan-N-acetylglucosamine deacetylase